MIKIINLYWERANLHIVFNKKAKDDIYLSSEKQKLKLEKISDKEIVLSITNTPEGNMLDADTWFLMCDEDITLDKEVLKVLNDKSRNFLYREEKYAYLVNFKFDDELHLIIKTMFMMVNNKPEKFYRTNEARNFSGKLGKILTIIAVLLFNIVYKIVYFFSNISKTKKILFLTENSASLTGNLKALYDYMVANKCNYKIRVYAVNRYKNNMNVFGMFKEIFYVARSNVIFLDNYTPLLTHITLAREVKLVQLWHAGLGFKAVGYARFGLDGSPHPLKSCHRRYTHVVVDQDKLINIYEEVFGCDKNVFYSYGMPRIDNYLNLDVIKEKTNELYKLNNNFKTRKNILFAPTYRGLGQSDAYYDMSKIDLNEMGKYCLDNDFNFIIKLHPFIDRKIDIPKEYKDYIYNYKDIDINDLIYIADIMITDYSSCAYEYSMFNRPLIFYRYDKEEYETLRPLHTLDVFSSVQEEIITFEELMKILSKYSKIDIGKRFDNIGKTINHDSCKKIVKEIIGE